MCKVDAPRVVLFTRHIAHTFALVKRLLDPLLLQICTAQNNLTKADTTSCVFSLLCRVSESVPVFVGLSGIHVLISSFVLRLWAL